MDGEVKHCKATFAAGRFWCVEPHFSYVAGVISTTVGFTGGDTPSPNYAAVGAGGTGHAEAVEIVFDPARVRYEALLRIFWAIHDPTTLNRQGPDHGDQYRSAIFCHDDSQRHAAEQSRQELLDSGRLSSAIVTLIVPAGPFHPADEYHQRYLEKRKLVGGRH